VLLDMYGQRVRSLREQKGMCRGQLAEASSVSSEDAPERRALGKTHAWGWRGPQDRRCPRGVSSQPGHGSVSGVGYSTEPGLSFVLCPGPRPVFFS